MNYIDNVNKTHSRARDLQLGVGTVGTPTCTSPLCNIWCFLFTVVCGGQDRER